MLFCAFRILIFLLIQSILRRIENDYAMSYVLIYMLNKNLIIFFQDKEVEITEGDNDFTKIPQYNKTE